MGPTPIHIGIKFDEVIQKGGIYFQWFKTFHVGPIEEPQELSIQALEVGVQLEESLANSDLQEICKLHGGATYKNSKLLKKKLHCGANEFAVNPLIKQSGQKKLKC